MDRSNRLKVDTRAEKSKTPSEYRDDEIGGDDSPTVKDSIAHIDRPATTGWQCSFRPGSNRASIGRTVYQTGPVAVASRREPFRGGVYFLNISPSPFAANSNAEIENPPKPNIKPERPLPDA